MSSAITAADYSGYWKLAGKVVGGGIGETGMSGSQGAGFEFREFGAALCIHDHDSRKLCGRS